MNWRRVIQIMGGVCIVVGVLSLCNNLSEFASGLIGPDEQMAEAEGMPAMMKESSMASSHALEHGVFRGYIIVQGAISSVMAIMLIVAGIGLLRLLQWGRRLALVWSVYAVVGTVIYVVMVSRYLLPEVVAASNQSLPAGFEIVVAVMMLIVLWVFPVALFTLLKLAPVVRMMEDVSRLPKPVRPSFDPPNQIQSSPAPLESDAVPISQDPPPPQQTWRDDPWNDPSVT